MKYIYMMVEYDDEEVYRMTRAKLGGLYKKNGMKIKAYREFNSDKDIKAEKMFSFKTIEGHKILQYSEILYMKKELRKVFVHTTRGDYMFYGKMNDIIESLDMRYFVLPHKSYIVNKNKILATDSYNIHVRNSCELIPISKRNKHNVKEMLKEMEIKSIYTVRKKKELSRSKEIMSQPHSGRL